MPFSGAGKVFANSQEIKSAESLSLG